MARLRAKLLYHVFYPTGAEVEEHGPKPRHLTFHNDKMLDITRAADSPNGTSTSVSGKAETFPFDFDHVFAPETSQVTFNLLLFPLRSIWLHLY